MGFTVNLFTFSKRDNSTAQPTGTGTEFTCVLKSGSGIMRPVLAFDIGLSSDPSSYNYAYIAAFDRYYFIEEWYFDRALWTATLKVDVLATYKTEIGAASLYVLRAAGDHDGDIIDTLYPAKTGCSYASDVKTNPWWNDLSWVVGVISRSSNMGSMAYYGMDSANCVTMCQNLQDRSFIITAANGFDLTELSDALQLSLVDPIQYVKTCMALPVSITDLANIGSLAAVYAYSWDTQATGYKILQAPYINKSFTFDISKHPDTNTRGNYVNASPFTSITLTLPPFGTIDIDTSVTCSASTLTADVRIDPITGKGILTVSCNNIVLNRVEAQLGVPISLSSVTRDMLGVAGSLAGGLGGAITGGLSGNIAGGLSSVFTGIGNAVGSIMPRASTVGTSGGFATGMGDFRLDHQFFRPVDDDNAHNGRPLCKMKTISSLSGYILVQDGDVSTTGTSSEDAAIRTYLENGFYYE